MKRVAIYESSSCWGGTAKYVATLIKRLDASRFQVTLFVDAREGVYRDPELPAEIVLHRDLKGVQSQRLPVKLFNVCRVLGNVPYHLYQLLRRRIQVVHTNNDILKHVPVLLAARLLNLKVICHVHDHRELTRLERVAVRLVDRLVVLTEAAKRLHSGHLDPERIVAAHNGIEVDRQPAPGPELPAVTSPGVAVVGRLEEWKGQEIFLRSLPRVRAALPSVTYYIVGDSMGCDDAYKNRLLQLAEELALDDSVRFLGWVAGAERLMERFDLTVCSSIRPEPFGFVVIESLFAGTPVIATRHGGPLEVIVEGVNGLFYEPLDAAGLADGIISLLQDPARLRDMGLEGRRHVRDNFSLGKNVRVIEGLYESA